MEGWGNFTALMLFNSKNLEKHRKSIIFVVLLLGGLAINCNLPYTCHE